MGEYRRYVTRVEARVVVEEVRLEGVSVPVGEFVVHAEAGGDTRNGVPVMMMVESAVMAARKKARAMAAGVENNEKARVS